MSGMEPGEMGPPERHDWTAEDAEEKSAIARALDGRVRVKIREEIVNGRWRLWANGVLVKDEPSPYPPGAAPYVEFDPRSLPGG